MHRIRIYIHNPKNIIIVEERDKKNVLVINNIFLKRETKGGESNININNDFWEVIHQNRFSSKDKLIRVINNIYQRNTFVIL